MSSLAFLSTAFEHRALIADLVRRDFKIRYLGSIMGSYWNFLHPLAMIAVYSTVFSYIMKIKVGATQSSLDFTFYLCAGLLPWTGFQEMTTRGCLQFQEYGSFIRRVAFPKEIVQLVATGSAAIPLLISTSLLCAVQLLSGRGLGISLLALPLILLLQMIFASGLGLLLGVINVFLRDMQQLLAIGFQIWFWLTPIVYHLDHIPQRLQPLLLFNPFFPFARMYQTVLFEQQWPQPMHLALAAAWAFLIFSLAASFFQAMKTRIADEL